MPPNLLIIFVKAPRSGQVKTRLAKIIGPESARDAYLSLVNIVVGNLRDISNVQLRFTPDDALPEIPMWVQPGWSSAAQGPGDLGQRISAAFQQAFAAGAQRVVVIGSDSPDVTREDIEAAWKALETHDVVVGPGDDGGYWLIGLRAANPDLFANMEWSSSLVLEETLARAQAAKLSTHLLRQLPDIDTIDDLQKFKTRTTPPQ